MKKTNPWAIVVTVVALAAVGAGGYMYWLQTTGPVVVTHRFTTQELQQLKSGPPPKKSDTKATTPASTDAKAKVNH